MAKMYRVNSSEVFNLESMYNKLKCMEIDFLKVIRQIGMILMKYRQE